MMALLALLALGAEPEGELVAALEAEMARAAEELKLPDSPGIYHLRYKLALLDSLDVEAELGGLIRFDTSPYHGIGVEVRIGEPAWDNTGFGGWQDGFRVTGTKAEPTARAIALDAWRLTDRAFKDAVEQYSRKQAQAVRDPDHPGDYQILGPTVSVQRGRSGVDASERLVALAEDLSAELGMAPDVEVARIFIGHETGSIWVIDTEGTRVRRPISEVSIRALAHTRADDGMRLTDQLLWTVREPEDLPDAAAMRAQVREMVTRLDALADAPLLNEEYVGPVLFEQSATADLFRWILLPQLEGTPPEIPFDTFIGDLGSGSGGARLLRRVLPAGWSVVDDPTAVPTHPGSYTHDWEGTPARAVELVEDGIVRDLLMSRTPRRGTDGSNGHGRGSLGQRAVGQASLTRVVPARTLSDARLRKAALRAAAAYDRDHVLVVRRFQHPSLMSWGESEYFDASLPPPVEVVRLYADGREERVRGVTFSGVQRWVLRDILAAGRPVTRDFLTALGGNDAVLGPVDGAPCRIEAPAVLIGELEVVPTPPDPTRARRLPPPG